ncbi:MAG TPA: NAD-dependent epimerase/dehydratase family protein [Candidatus Baltobacterales bacterium]|nr:NAD-dependent epimerase/dehydratase family protein [Candidatus Baltobacterales bacterium]
MHLVIGSGEFLGDHVSAALAPEVPVIALNADADDETLADAFRGVEVVINCARSKSPARRLKFRKYPPTMLQRVLATAERTGVRRIVHVSSADVYGPDHFARITEKSSLRPAHAFERLTLFEEQWLVEAAHNVEVVVVRPTRIFGIGEDWILPRVMASVARGRIWLPHGGRATQTFVAAADVGRACLAAGDRGRPGQAYLVAGFDSSWRELIESASRAAGFEAVIQSIPYDLAYIRALAVETMTAQGATAWPGLFAVDVIGKPHYYDDSHSRRELTWSPSVGSFEQEMPAMTQWLAGLPEVSAALAAEASEALTSPPGR